MGSILFVASTFDHIRNFPLPYLTDLTEQGWEVGVSCAGVWMALLSARKLYPIPL